MHFKDKIANRNLPYLYIHRIQKFGNRVDMHNSWLLRLFWHMLLSRIYSPHYFYIQPIDIYLQQVHKVVDKYKILLKRKNIELAAKSRIFLKPCTKIEWIEIDQT